MLHRLHRLLRVAALGLLALAGTSGSLAAQDADEGRWNSSRVLELVERGRQARRRTVVDADMTSYQADARGYVYFFIDRPDSDERTLVKADQIALEIFWHAPNLTKQRIVGLRDEKVLPTNIRYHLDHLTVVQDDFGDYIRLGDGDEVERVLHPVGPGSEGAYDYLLTDSLTLRYGGAGDEVRVYEVRVRPRDPDAPGFIGSVYLDRANAAIVRMNFTFTPASYVDPYLDYIRISLDNSLWMGEFWLPYRQEAEIRRELPALDFLAGSIIRGRFEIGPYDFNVDIPPVVFRGRGVSTVAPEQRERFPFEEGLFADLEERGLAPAPRLEEISAQAREMMQERYLSGLNPLRLYVSSFSDALRYNRAEGTYVGAGVHLRPRGDAVLRLTGGYAFGRDEPAASASLTAESGPVVPTLRVYENELRDVGGVRAAGGVINSMGAAFLSEDWLDPWFARGAELRLAGEDAPEEGTTVSLVWERHTRATDVVSDGDASDFRPVRPVREGILGSVRMRNARGLPWGGRGHATAELSRLGNRTWAGLRGRAEWEREDPSGDGWSTRFSVDAGGLTDQAPVQAAYFLGGRGTLPGHAYRAWAGHAFGLARVEATRPLRAPWVSLRTFAAVGGTWLSDGTTFAGGVEGVDSGGLRASVGAGLAFGWDVLRLDLARGLRDGNWELTFSVAPSFRPWL